MAIAGSKGRWKNTLSDTTSSPPSLRTNVKERSADSGKCCKKCNVIHSVGPGCLAGDEVALVYITYTFSSSSLLKLSFFFMILSY